MTEPMNEDWDRDNIILTTTGSIRKGIDYQDACAALLFVNWLKAPSFYEWAKLEADEFGYLDDIAIYDKNDAIWLKQIKLSCHPEVSGDEWTWDSIVKERKNTKGDAKPSLLRKWFESWLREKKKKTYSIIYVQLISNRRAGNDIQDSTENRKSRRGKFVNFNKFKSSYQKYYLEALKQIHPSTEKDLEAFFDDFEFCLDEPSPEVTWENAERIFESLGGERNNWLIFKETIRKWATVRTEPSFSGKIKIEDLRIAAGWIKLHSLNENFFIPDDFMLFDSYIHKNMISRVKKSSSGVQVFYGSPGVGKSTYLSNLAKKLTEGKLFVLRHHYYISLDDPDFNERLKSERAKEALKSEIYRKFGSGIADLANRNPKTIRLKECLQILSKELTKQKNNLTIIIDGLDHVITHSQKQELKDFLNELFPCLPGIWIILGTRPLEEDIYPPSVFQGCPKKDWIEINPLSRTSVYAIINISIKKKRIKLPDNFLIKREFYRKFYEVTQGHPLHIQYTLKKLANLSLKNLLTVRDIEDIPPYGGDIEAYYSELWRRMPIEARDMVILMATAGFSLEEEQILDILNTASGRLQLLTKEFEQIQYLVKRTMKGLVFFHSSFKAYILSTEEYGRTNLIVKRFLKDWVGTKAPEHIRWQNLLKLEYELGNDTPLLTSLTKDWVIQAISDLKSFKGITNQLDLGIDAAMKKELFSDALLFGLLSVEVENCLLANADNYDKLFLLLLKLQNKVNLNLFLNEDTIPYMSSKRLNLILEIVNTAERNDIVNTIFNELNHGWDRDETNYGNIQPREDALSKAAAYTHIEPKRVLNYIQKFDQPEQKDLVLMTYCHGLLETKQFDNVEVLFKLGLPDYMKKNILESYMHYCLTEKIDKTSFLIKQRNEIWGNNSLLTLMLSEKLPKKVKASLPLYDSFPIKLKDYKREERSSATRLFYNCYFSALILGYKGEGAIVENWIRECSLEYWGVKAALFLADLGKIHGEKIKRKEKLDYEALIPEPNKLRTLVWHEDREAFEVFLAFNDSLEKIFDLAKLLNYRLNKPYAIEQDVLKMYCDSDFFGKSRLLKNLAYEKRPYLSKETCVTFLEQEEKEMITLVEHFSNRVEYYIDLAFLAILHSEDAIRDRLIKKAILNMLGYGYKDAYHLDVLECINSCHHSNSSMCKGWLDRMAFLIAEVTNYSDDTRFILDELSKSYVLINPQRLKNFYVSNASKENLFLAEDIFPYVAESSCIDTPFDRALLKTGVDRATISKLKKLSASKNRVAEAVLLEQEKEFFELETIPVDKDKFSEDTKIDRPVFDYGTVPPAKFFDHLESIKELYQKDSFARSWAEYWLSKPQFKEEAYRILLTWIESVDRKVDFQILDLLYPLALEFEGKDKSYTILVHAHLRGYGWSGRYFSREETVKNRWEFMKTNFPEKAKDFLRDTLLIKDDNGSQKYTGFLPIPRGVEFLNYFGFVKEAESMTEMAVRFAEGLMADLKLPDQPWINENLLDSLDVLLSRLIWPSPLIRERAATALSFLLSDKIVSKAVLQRLSNWLRKRDLESITVLALLPIVKSTRRDGKNSPLDFESIKKIILRPSINTESILKEIARSMGGNLLTKDKFEETREPQNLSICPREYEPSKFFLNYAKSFLPQMHFLKAERLRDETGYDLIKQWGWEAEHIEKELNVHEELGEVMDFYGRSNGSLMIGMSSLFSEIFNASFIRSIYIGYKLGHIPKQILLKWTFSHCPVDLSFWDIFSQQTPKWWPNMNQSSGSKIDISRSGIWESINDLITSSESRHKVLAIDGPLRPFDGWFKNSLDTTIMLIPFAYRIRGGKLPDPKELINDGTLYSFISLNVDSSSPLSYFDPSNKYLNQDSIGGSREKDMTTFPLVSKLRTLPLNFWQAFRVYREPFGLSENLFSLANRMKPGQDSWAFFEKDKEVAVGYTWRVGFFERQADGFDVPSGQVIEIDRAWLEKILEYQKVRLGYVARVNMTFREYSFEKPKIYEEAGFINISPLII